MPGKKPFILFTDNTCIIGDVPRPGIPLLVNYNNRIIEAPSDWLRHLILVRRKSLGSVRQFAYHLRYWWSYLNRRGYIWDTVSDFIFMNWLDEYRKRNLNDEVVNGYASTVFRMYLWTERNGYTHGLIGEPDFENDVHPPLSIKVTDRRGFKTYTSPFLVQTTAKSILPTPTNDQITKVHEALAELYKHNFHLMIRDALILSWMEQTGTRRTETLNLKMSQIPEWAEILTLDESGEKKELTVLGKGNKKRSILVGADLLSQTREYLEEERQVVLDHFIKLYGSVYKNPEEVFLSTKTGRVLHADSISQKFAKAFRKAGVKGSGHRVRARFLTNLAVKTFERELERLGSVPDLISTLLPVAQIAGHNRIETLIPYLDVAKKRLLQKTVTERVAAAEERAIAAERHLNINLIRLKQIDSVQALVKAVRLGSKKKIIAELQKLYTIYDQ